MSAAMNQPSVDWLQILRDEVQKKGSNAALARVIGVHESLISLLLSGLRKPGPTILDYLGLEKVVVTTVTYVRKNVKPSRRKKIDRAAAEA